MQESPAAPKVDAPQESTLSLGRTHSFSEVGRGERGRKRSGEERCSAGEWWVEGGREVEGRRQDVLLWSSDALEQVGVAVGASAAVAQHPDARPPSHGAAVAHPALGARDTR